MGFEPLREEEEITFFGENKIATPARVATIRSQGGRQSPEGQIDHLRHEGVGKAIPSDVIDTHLPNSYNV